METNTDASTVTTVTTTTTSSATSTTKEIRKEGLDKFYTIRSYAKKCIDRVFDMYPCDTFDFILEPSAGNGSFYDQLHVENKLGLDICPETENLMKMDFFQYIPPPLYKRILVIGNPPFGRVSSTAIKFFNHASRWAQVIAFIIPRTFRKASVQNKLHKSFHLVHDEDVPTNPCSFTPKIMVKCCFQIWEKRSVERKHIHLPTTHHDWTFLSWGPFDNNGQPTPPNGADFAIRAYGGKIGHIQQEGLEDLRPKSWHWIQCNHIKKETLISRFSQLDYSNSLNTARQNSMGRGELVALYSNFIQSEL